MISKNISLVGQAIRSIRTQKGLSLQALADRAGVAVGVLSQIERDIGNPSLKTLTKIQLALEVPLSRLFESDADVKNLNGLEGACEHLVRRKVARKELQFGSPLLTKEMLSPVQSSRLQFMILKLLPGGCSGDSPLSYPAIKGGLVLEGSFLLKLDGDDLVLFEGDSFQFDGSIPHIFSNLSSEPAQLLWIISYEPIGRSL